MDLEQRETILFIEERFHPNQHPMVKYLREQGHTVEFLSLRRQATEEYSAVEPNLVNYSYFFEFVYRLLRGETNRESIHETSDKILHKFGVPSLSWYYEYLVATDPDLVILKGYNLITYITIVYGRLLDIDLLFYDQDPVYLQTSTSRSRALARRLHTAMRSDAFVRVSPVLGGEEEASVIPNSYYLPFVAEPHPEASTREYAPDGTVRFVMVGKFNSPRKNHLQLLRVVTKLADSYDLRLTLIGKLNDPEGAYFERINQFINENELGDLVEVLPNMDYQKVQQAYLNHDVYVLPSSAERAAVSHLEAMAHGLAVICTDTNGTRCYIDEGENGYIIETGNDSQLHNRLTTFLDKPSRIQCFGQRSYELAESEYSGDRFYERLSEIVNQQF